MIVGERPQSLTLVVLAKRPRPGRVKTRLTPPLTPAEAATLAAAALRDTIAVVDAAPVQTRVLAFDRHAADWLPAGWRYWRQARGGLDRRIATTLAGAAGQPSVLVGMDTPQLTAAQLTAFDAEHYDACLGPAADGGFWAIGFADPSLAASAVTGVPMSTPDTGAIQLARLYSLGLRVQLLDELVDVDTVDTAAQVAIAAPHTEFARTLAQLPAALPVLRRAA